MLGALIVLPLLLQESPAAWLKLNVIAPRLHVSEEYAAKGAATANIVDFDDVVVARSYIGPVAPAKRP